MVPMQKVFSGGEAAYQNIKKKLEYEIYVLKKIKNSLLISRI